MKRKTGVAVVLMLLMVMMMFSVQADAAWVKTSSGGYIYKDNTGKKLPSKWFSEKKVGFVTKNGATYCYKLNGKLYKGWLTVGNTKYFMTSKGKLLKSKWLVSGGKKYFASKNGKIYRNCIVKIGSNYYGFNDQGVMQTGKAAVKGKTYYFYKKSGKMLRKAFVTISGKKYYFGANGVMGNKVWVKNYYVNESGYVETNAWVGDKYVGANGHPLKGFQKIGNDYYFFDNASCKKLVNTIKKVDGKEYLFDSEGKAIPKEKINETRKPSVSVQTTYYTDPVVSDETLLAAIIYCESGNQPYYGQVAVGLVITNRMRSNSFPSKLKEVVYQTVQFSPTFDGQLTRTLNDQGRITASCKAAAREVLEKYRTGNYEITVEEENKDLKDYLFFMTMPAYERLKLTAPYEKLGDHVFFQKWQK